MPNTSGLGDEGLRMGGKEEKGKDVFLVAVFYIMLAFGHRKCEG